MAGASCIEKPIAMCSANLFFSRIGSVTTHESQELSGDFFWHGNTVYPRFYSTERAITKIGITEPQSPWSPSRRPFTFPWFFAQQRIHDLHDGAPVIHDFSAHPAAWQLLREPIAVHPKQILQSPHVGNGIDSDPRHPRQQTRQHFVFTNTATEDVIKTRRLISFAVAAKFVFD